MISFMRGGPRGRGGRGGGMDMFARGRGRGRGAPRGGHGDAPRGGNAPINADSAGQKPQATAKPDDSG